MGRSVVQDAATNQLDVLEVPAPGHPDRKRILNVLAQRRYRKRRSARLAALEAKARETGTASIAPPGLSIAGPNNLTPVSSSTSNSHITTPVSLTCSGLVPEKPFPTGILPALDHQSSLSYYSYSSPFFYSGGPSVSHTTSSAYIKAANSSSAYPPVSSTSGSDITGPFNDHSSTSTVSLSWSTPAHNLYSHIRHNEDNSSPNEFSVSGASSIQPAGLDPECEARPNLYNAQYNRYDNSLEWNQLVRPIRDASLLSTSSALVESSLVQDSQVAQGFTIIPNSGYKPNPFLIQICPQSTSFVRGLMCAFYDILRFKRREIDNQQDPHRYSDTTFSKEDILWTLQALSLTGKISDSSNSLSKDSGLDNLLYITHQRPNNEPSVAPAIQNDGYRLSSSIGSSPPPSLDWPAAKIIRVGLAMAERLGVCSDLFNPDAKILYRTRTPDGQVRIDFCTEEDPPDSHFGSQTRTLLVNPERMPEAFLPTDVQQTIPHHPLLSLLPWPSVRMRLIAAFDLPDELRPTWVAKGPNGIKRLICCIDNPCSGFRIHGPYGTDSNAWEIGDAFVRYWWWALDQNVLTATNQRRSLRGQAPYIIEDIRRNRRFGASEKCGTGGAR